MSLVLPRPARLLLLVPAMSLLLAGCGDSGDADDSTVTQPTGGATSSGPGASAGTKLGIKDFAYNPATLTVAPGATIDVTNNDSAGHDVFSDEKDLFKTEILDEDQTQSFTAPTKPGTYTYICSVHPNMKGSIVVK